METLFVKFPARDTEGSMDFYVDITRIESFVDNHIILAHDSCYGTSLTADEIAERIKEALDAR